jgi:hypothetical protein
MASRTTMTTKNLVQIANKFAAAFAACNAAKTREEFKAVEPTLDAALIAYRKAHGISDAFGLLDCVNHFNRTYANA